MSEKEYINLYRKLRPLLFYDEENGKHKNSIVHGLLEYLGRSQYIANLSKELDNIIKKAIEQYEKDLENNPLLGKDAKIVSNLSSFRHGIITTSTKCSEELSKNQEVIIQLFKHINEWSSNLP